MFAIIHHIEKQSEQTLFHLLFAQRYQGKEAKFRKCYNLSTKPEPYHSNGIHYSVVGQVDGISQIERMFIFFVELTI